jgi:hypothetical protein
MDETGTAHRQARLLSRVKPDAWGCVRCYASTAAGPSLTTPHFHAAGVWEPRSVRFELDAEA